MCIIVNILVVRQQFFSEPETKSVKIDGWDEIKFNGWSTGPNNAKVKIVEFFDYQCIYCDQVNLTLNALKEEFGESISITYQHYPLNRSSGAYDAAIAAECARSQDQFFSYHNTLYENQLLIGAVSFDSLATVANIADINQFKDCVEIGGNKQSIEYSTNIGKTLKVEAVPTFLVNGYVIKGALPYEAFKQLIEEELKK